MPESVHDKLQRVRKPRVHLRLDVETEGAEVENELPFVVGVMGDFSGNPTGKLKPLRDRNFTAIDRDNFNEVMAKMMPGLVLPDVENTMAGDGTFLPVQLKFDNMSKFEPGEVARQVPELKKLLETREKLRGLETTMGFSQDLEGVLDKVLQNSSNLEQLSKELGENKPTS